MRSVLRTISDTLVIVSAGLGIAGTLTDYGVSASLLFAQNLPVESAPIDSLNVKIESLLHQDISSLFSNFTEVVYDSQTKTDNLQTILEKEKLPAIVFQYDSEEGIEISKKQAVTLKLLSETVSSIRFVAFSYDIIPGSNREKAEYLKKKYGFPGTPSTQLYVPSTTQGSGTVLLDTQFGAPKNISDIMTSVSDLSEYWLATNIFQSGERTVYRFNKTFDWHELRADGHGNILDPSDNNRIVGRDVDPELVRTWNSLREEHQQSQNSSAHSDK